MKNIFATWAIMTLALAVGGCRSVDDTVDGNIPPPQIPETQKISPSNTVVIGESLEIFVTEDKEFGGVYTVRERGDIILPKVGRLFVAGKTVEGVQSAVEEALEASQLKDATVIVDRVRKVQGQAFSEMPKLLVYVVGSVARPGQHMIAVKPGVPTFAYDAVLIAGGLNQFADERGAYVLRRSADGERVKIPLDLRALRQGAGRDVQLGEGDMVFVPQRKFMF
jgi:polysaccharide export outer membrane protein